MYIKKDNKLVYTRLGDNKNEVLLSSIYPLLRNSIPLNAKNRNTKRRFSARNYASFLSSLPISRERECIYILNMV